MTEGVCYMLVGTKHAVVMAVSLYSLRKHYDGPVALIAGDDSAHEICSRCVADERLCPAMLTRWDAPTKGQTGQSGQQYFNKCEIDRLTPFEHTVFLDADTLVLGDISDLWQPRYDVCLTQFCDWTTRDHSPVPKRVENWRDVAPKEVAVMLSHPYPAINTGIYSFRKGSRYMAAWKEMTSRKVTFMADELASQLIFPYYPHMIFDDRWNWSPMHSKTPLDDVRVCHFHGRKHCRRERCPRGFEIWVPAFREAYEQNIAQLREWCPARDGNLKRHWDEVISCKLITTS